MNPETLILIARLTSLGLGVLQEMDALMKRVNAGEEITDAEIDQGNQRVDEAVARWNEAKQA